MKQVTILIVALLIAAGCVKRLQPFHKKSEKKKVVQIKKKKNGLDDNGLMINKTRAIKLHQEPTGLLVQPKQRGILLKPNIQRFNLSASGGTPWIPSLNFQLAGNAAAVPLFYPRQETVMIGHDCLPVKNGGDFGWYVDMSGRGSSRSNPDLIRLEDESIYGGACICDACYQLMISGHSPHRTVSTNVKFCSCKTCTKHRDKILDAIKHKKK